MKKNILYLAAAAVIALGFTSCNKDEKTDEGMQFRATMENTEAKTALVGTHVNWVEGDEVMIYGTEQNGLYRATPDAEDARSATLTKVGQPVISNGGVFRAIYPAASAVSANSFTIPAVQESVDGSLANTFPMYAESYDENLEFKNLCGVLKIHLQQEGAKVSRIVVTAASEINGTFNIDNSGEEPAISYNNGGKRSTTLVCSEAQDITNGKDFYIYMPAGEYSGLTIKLQNEGYGVVKNAPANAVVEILRSQYSTLSFTNVNMPIPPDNDHKWGLFSVSDNLQVWLAPGNLQYNKRTQAWRFAEHQYDVVTNTSTWMGLFCWGASGYDVYSASYTGTDTNALPHPYLVGDISATNYDWAWYNAIGDDPANTWRSLNRYEFEYLMGSPTQTIPGYGGSNNRGAKMWSRATLNINGTTIKGVVVLPDIWYDDNANNFGAAGGNTDSRYENLTYDAESWAEMEARGAAFLPCAGSRRGTSVTNNGETWGYWHTTAVQLSASSKISPARFHIGDDGWNTTMTTNTINGFAIRPAKDYVPASK